MCLSSYRLWMSGGARWPDPAGCRPVNAVQHLYRLGGVASRRQLLAVAGRGEVDQALRSGAILRDARGRYAVPVADVGVRAAGALSGVASHRTAAARGGWAQKQPDSQPEVTVPRKRKVPTDRRTGVVVHWAELSVDDVDGPCTSPRRTMVAGRPTAPARAGGRLVRLARQPSGTPAGLPALQPARPARVHRPPLHVGGRHA